VLCLDKPFEEVVGALKLKKKITPRAMRRTFQNLARAAEVKDVVTRAVSGHATDAMPRHYSTVSPAEMRTSLAKVIDLVGIRKALAA
jgi:integrase